MKHFFFVAVVWAGVAFADIPPVPPTAPAPPAPAAVHPEGIEKVPTGVIQGGWGYVYACYIVAIGGTLFYAMSLFARRPRGEPRKEGRQS